MNHLIRRLRQSSQPTILAIIIVEMLVFVLQDAFGFSWLSEFGAKPAEFSQAWAEFQAAGSAKPLLAVAPMLFAPLFLHIGLEHVLFNMVFLWTFGSLTARHLGSRWAVVLFLICGACGNLLQIGLNPTSPIPIVGASGAVCGFQGVYLGLALRWQLKWPDVWPLANPIPPMQLAAFALIGIGFDFYSLMNHEQQVAYGAHVGGFLAGLFLALLITRFRSDRS